MRVLIRTDASRQIGSGHLMRCLTLARALHEKGAEVDFACRVLQGAPLEKVSLAGCTLLSLPALDGPDPPPGPLDPMADLAQLEQLIDRRTPYDLLIVDHYGLDARWERVAHQWSPQLLVLDDLANRPHDCEWLLDQNLYADPQTRYQALVPKACHRLIGLDYVLLRPEFVQLRSTVTTRRRVGRVLASFGGTDPGNESSKILQAWQALPGNLRLDLVVGSGHAHRASLEAAMLGDDRVRLFFDTPLMAELICGADLALGAAGSSAWERCCLGLPSLTIVSADNQREVATALSHAGAAICLGVADTVSAADWAKAINRLCAEPDTVSAMSRAAMALVDGSGVQRVLQQLLANT
ncbi:UDP-2,4-diacetamido-2,4,6-trideoxy-beta-L-altropyranose hydrolase [Parachitinimonas caeni]|uniref:UDP-2,4-diacetamido-2,4, 6-trideoxy-beta-L-altropyranose hydrolase n=1 Tax=Parachitinimonas caeni TaxID=3031301 RepID=A0ABT7E0M9_9NEIS|nr:UDP-2,4-diacetamido-2,4,6-trideoxy-beta-L-altropyranose hydrolase [Parachitinimonas caeni]MDK2125870.1 UDP-2,4-diacetamido-2,4,6-trideoxy-beta-L-altropyranose hydrolase [Parachitinimonas caeni]